MPEPAAGWASLAGPLPTSVLAPVADPALQARLELLHARQDALAARVAIIARRLADLPDELREALIAPLRGEISEGLAKAHLAGRQAAVSAQSCTLVGCIGEGPEIYGVTLAPPCTLCAAAGGEGCVSPTCRRPAC